MKYVIMDERTNDIFTQEFETKKEAIQAGVKAWDYLTEAEKKKVIAFYVIESVNPDPEAENHLDGVPVKAWK